MRRVTLQLPGPYSREDFIQLSPVEELGKQVTDMGFLPPIKNNFGNAKFTARIESRTPSGTELVQERYCDVSMLRPTHQQTPTKPSLNPMPFPDGLPSHLPLFAKGLLEAGIAPGDYSALTPHGRVGYSIHGISNRELLWGILNRCGIDFCDTPDRVNVVFEYPIPSIIENMKNAIQHYPDHLLSPLAPIAVRIAVSKAGGTFEQKEGHFLCHFPTQQQKVNFKKAHSAEALPSEAPKWIFEDAGETSVAVSNRALRGMRIPVGTSVQHPDGHWIVFGGATKMGMRLFKRSEKPSEGESQSWDKVFQKTGSCPLESCNCKPIEFKQFLTLLFPPDNG